jgi:peptidoglycan LD-endopeptidase LytH
MKHKFQKYGLNFIKMFSITLIVPFLIPSNPITPILKRDITKIDPESFWYFPWGDQGVHKGIDIFCEKNTAVVAPISGYVYSIGNGKVSGNYVYILGPKWRTYYFAHLDTILINKNAFVSKGNVIGKVGNSGNAQNKPYHLHFSIETIFPYFWLKDNNTLEGEKKMYYLDPNEYINFKE